MIACRSRDTLLDQGTSRIYHPRHRESGDDISLRLYTLPLLSQYRYSDLVSPRHHDHSPDHECIVFPGSV